MELETGWGGGARSNEQAHGGIYSWKVTSTNNVAARATQDLSGWKPGIEYTFRAWVYNGNGDPTGKIGIDDGVSETLSGWPPSDAWTELTITKTLAHNATRLRLVLYCLYTQAGSSSVYFDDATLTHTAIDAGVPYAFCKYNSKLYGGFGKCLGKLNDTGTAFDLVIQFANTITSLEVFGDYLYIAVGGSNKYWYMSTAEAFTESTLAAGLGEADLFRKVGTKLWKMVLPNKVRSATDPTNAGTWSAEKTVGEATYNVNDLQSYLELIYCMKENGVYYFDADGNVKHPFESLESIAHADSGKNSDVFRNRLYFRMGNQKEWVIDGASIDEITPSLFALGIAEYAYPCIARAHDESWLYDIMKRGAGDFAVLAGRWEYISGRTRWIWHEIASITLNDVTSALVSSVEGRPFLYIGADDGAVKVYLPTTSDATADSGYRFCLAGSVWSPRYMTLLFAFDKKWQEIFARSKSLSATNYINVYRSTDDGGSFTLLGKLDDSPEKTLTYPAGIEASMMNLRLDFVADSETVPPVLQYYDLKAMTLVPSVVTFSHTIKCAGGLKLKENIIAPATYGASDIRTFIDSLRDNVCLLGDRWGTEHSVMVRVTREIEVFDEDTKKPETQFSLEAVQL